MCSLTSKDSELCSYFLALGWFLSYSFSIRWTVKSYLVLAVHESLFLKKLPAIHSLKTSMWGSMFAKNRGHSALPCLSFSEWHSRPATLWVLPLASPVEVIHCLLFQACVEKDKMQRLVLIFLFLSFFLFFFSSQKKQVRAGAKLRNWCLGGIWTWTLRAHILTWLSSPRRTSHRFALSLSLPVLLPKNLWTFQPKSSLYRGKLRLKHEVQHSRLPSYLLDGKAGIWGFQFPKPCSFHCSFLLSLLICILI